MLIRQSGAGDFAGILGIINDAAVAYRGVIPADRWHEPYMSASDLETQIAEGVVFWIAEQEGHLLGVMGIQDKGMSLWYDTRMWLQRRSGAAWAQNSCVTWKALSTRPS